MSGHALGWAKRQAAPSMVAKAVLVCLADYADADGVAWPKIKTLAEEVQASPRTVQRAIRALEEIGLLVRDERFRTDAAQTSNAYRLCMAEAPHDRMTPPRCQDVMAPVTPVSPLIEPPFEPTPSDEGVRAPAMKDFDFWWAAYPSKVGKRTAEAAYAKAVQRLRKADPSADPHGVLNAGLQRALHSARWRNPTYTLPNPATWLNQDRWEDEDATAPGAGPADTSRPAFDQTQLAARLALLQASA